MSRAVWMLIRLDEGAQMRPHDVPARIASKAAREREKRDGDRQQAAMVIRGNITAASVDLRISNAPTSFHLKVTSDGHGQHTVTAR